MNRYIHFGLVNFITYLTASGELSYNSDRGNWNLKRIRRWYQDLVLLIQMYFNPYKVPIIQFAGLNLFFSPKLGTKVNLSKFIYHWSDFEIVTVTIFHTNEKFQLKISWVTAQWHPNWSGAAIISTMRILDLSTLSLSGSNRPMLPPTESPQKMRQALPSFLEGSPPSWYQTFSLHMFMYDYQ